MRITIERIDTSAMETRGYMQLPSFPVHFRSTTVSGNARFIPASSELQQCVGQSFDVEINQEAVTEFEVSKCGGVDEAVVALPEQAAFRVHGVVTSVIQLSEPEGEQVITVKAKEAFFTLTQADVRDTQLSTGEVVSFVVHEVSLWDEAT
jgi:hypothetical protein